MNQYFYFAEGNVSNAAIIYRVSGVVHAKDGKEGYGEVIKDCQKYFTEKGVFGPNFSFSVMRFNRL